MDAKVTYSPHKRLSEPLRIPTDRLLLGPGPSNSHPRIRLASSLPLVGHLHPEFQEVMADITAGLQYLFQTCNSLTLAVSGTGHAGMEAAFVNLVETGDRVLILKNGMWGERGGEVASRCGAVVKMLERPTAQVFTLTDIEKGLSSFKPDILFVCHGESSTGVCQPLQGIGELCHKYNCLLLVDAVASLGGVPFHMDRWGVDVVYSGSQKVLGAPPGSAPISFSPRARAKMSQRKSPVQSFYLDMSWLERYWGIEGAKRVYHHTGPITNFYGLREALALLAEEGLEACWRRHRVNAEQLWGGLQELGLELFIANKAERLPTVTTINVPFGINWKNVTDYAMKNYNLEISGGLGPTTGKVWRIGLMGYNCSHGNVQKVLTVLKEALKQQQNHKL